MLCSYAPYNNYTERETMTNSANMLYGVPLVVKVPPYSSWGAIKNVYLPN